MRKNSTKRVGMKLSYLKWRRERGINQVFLVLYKRSCNRSMVEMRWVSFRLRGTRLSARIPLSCGGILTSLLVLLLQSLFSHCSSSGLSVTSGKVANLKRIISEELWMDEKRGGDVQFLDYGQLKWGLIG